MEILKREQYPEYEAFVLSHPLGSFTQSALWRLVKDKWRWEAVVSRNPEGAIVGSCGVLIRRVPFLGVSLLYAPRGPVCGLHDRGVLADLKAGVDALAKRYNAYSFKMDTEALASDGEFLAIAKEMGFSRFYGPGGYEGIQARFNYRLPLAGKTPEEVMTGFHPKTRYNIRVAGRHGVEIRVTDKSRLDEFMAVYEITGKRDGFSTRTKGYFETLLDALGDYARLYLGYYQNQAVCGAIAVNYGGTCSYVYGASDNAHRNVMSNYLMQWEMILWAMETGCTLYDFKGVSGERDNPNGHMAGLYRFKKGFGGGLVELAGELDYHYKPLVNRIVNWGVRLTVWLLRLKRKLWER